MNSSTVYSTSLGRGVNQNATTPAINIRAESGIDWMHYIIYFLVALLVVWGVLFILIRTGVVGPNDWLYENTKRIPYLSENSWARQTANNDTTNAANSSPSATTNNTN